MAVQQTNGAPPLTNGHVQNSSNGVHQKIFKYAAYRVAGNDISCIGSLDLDGGRMTPLTYKSGTPVRTLHEVIHASRGDLVESDHSLSVDEIELLPPIYKRDVLAVGKNYAEHAKEFNASGYDSSDKVDQPTHPVIFTKRATSIVAHGADISPHPAFTQTLDYEGEIGVIVGKPAYRISEADADRYIWGYTIINDITAREKQRDHKQFFLGKSADTFCPMGPVAMAKEDLPETLEVVTRVNGEQRQRATTQDLIFSIPKLIAVISEGQTLFPGDVIATGTPAGVGFGFHPPKWLQPGDEIEVSVTGLGTLKNRVGHSSKASKSVHDVFGINNQIPTFNTRALGSQGLVTMSEDKKLFYKTGGSPSGKPTLFIHGLGGTHDYFAALADKLQDHRSLHLFDLEGHGLSPVPASRTLSIASFANDAKSIAVQQIGVTSGWTIIAHSMGCLVAMTLAIDHPEFVDELVLMGPPPSPLPAAGATATYQRAYTVRTQGGMSAVAETVARAGTSTWSQKTNPMSFVAARLSLLSQHPEGYAKACHALADSSANTIDVARTGKGDNGKKVRTLILTGSEDKVSPPALCEKYHAKMTSSSDVTRDNQMVVLDNVAHWHLFEDHTRTIEAVCSFLAA